MLFYYILTGGDHPCGRSPADVQINITRGWPKPRDISPDVDDVMGSMLAFVPKARPSAHDVLRLKYISLIYRPVEVMVYNTQLYFIHIVTTQIHGCFSHLVIRDIVMILIH